MKIGVSICLVALPVFTGYALSPGSEIKAACGGRARVVWCQDAGDGTDAGAQGNSLRLMGLDTEDGRGERAILPDLSNYARPMLTSDGNKIIFSNRHERKIYAVSFDGSALKEIASGFALALRHDPLTGTDWVYAGTVVNQPDSVIINIRRFRLDKPDVSEPVWSKTPLNIDNFQLSADGLHASGLFPWPACGIAALPDREWTKYGDGCWPSLAPDNSLLFWIFDGAHRNLTMFQVKTGERWVLSINTAPGIDGFEVYHPRWGNHPLYMVMTGPYKMGTGSNRIRGGGKEVEIYLGKFAVDFKKIERWIRVTHNQSADFFPDLWVATPDESTARQRKTAEPEVLALPVERGLEGKKKASTDAWPGSFEGLVFLWQNRSKANAFTDPVSGLSHECRAEARGRARYGRHFEMAPSGGAFIAAGGAGELIKACAASGQLGVEALITPMKSVVKISSEPTPSALADFPSAGGDLKNLKLNRSGPPPWSGTQPVPPKSRLSGGRDEGGSGGWVRETQQKDFLLPIIGYAAESGDWNFLLGQQGRQLVFKLKAASGGPDYSIPVGDPAGEKPRHVIISCSTSSVACYLDGELVASQDGVHGGNWESGNIVFGNELRGEYPVNSGNKTGGWKGLIANVALYSRWIGPEEARKKYNAINEYTGAQKQVPALSVKAKLISMPVIPKPESIAPYRRALAVGHYKVEEVLEGACSNTEIMVARWAILDRQVIEAAMRRAGEIFPVNIEPFADHPELEGERLIMDSDRFDLPVYYEIEE